MLKFAAIFTFLAVASSSPVDDVIRGPPSDGPPKVPMLDGRIVGGSAVTITSYPWQLSLQRSSSHICGASIISSTWALTAAHCVDGASLRSFSLRAGSSYHASGGTLHSVSNGYVHGSYNSSTLDYDVAVLQVSSAFALGTSGVSAVALATYEPSTATTLYVSGWGTTTSGGSSLPSQLRAVDVPAISRESCRSSYVNSSITDRMLCAGYTAGGRDACQGDSGGPLVYGSTQVGIVSWGNGCALANYPGVYASIPALRAWIRTATGV